MSYPTRGAVKQRYQSTLDDYPQTVTSAFNENVFAPAFAEAYEQLFAALLTAQGAVIELIAELVAVPPYTTELTPADFGIIDMGEPIFLRERISGSTERFKPLVDVDVLPQLQPTTYLRYANWRNNTWYFLGATSLIDLEVKYEASSTAPTDDDAIIPIDNSLAYLANYAVGVSGGRKGYEDTATRCMNLAVGPKFSQGTIGGQLFILVQPSVRNRQQVQISHRPYQSGWGRRYSRFGATPFVAAQNGATGGGASNVPIQFSSQTGGVIGSIDGLNSIFWVNIGNVQTLVIFVNGVMRSVGVDLTYTNNLINFSPGSIPAPGSIITVEAFVANPTNYGTSVGPPP